MRLFTSFKLVIGVVCLLCISAVFSLLIENPEIYPSFGTKTMRWARESYFKGTRLLQDFVFKSLKRIVHVAHCASYCLHMDGCKSFNYNTFFQICELIMTDFQLNNVSLDFNSNKDWLYRAAGPLSRGCLQFNSLSECTFLAVNSSSTTQIKVNWQMPSDHDPDSVYLVDRFQIVAKNNIERGQMTTFPADVNKTFVKPTERVHELKTIPGMFYNISLRPMFRGQLCQNELFVQQTATPSIPMMNQVQPQAYVVGFQWLLDGVGDFVEIVSYPTNGTCDFSVDKRSICKLNFTTKDVEVANLIPGEDYWFYWRTVSHGVHSDVLSVNQPTQTGDIVYHLEKNELSPNFVTFVFTTQSGTGSKHEIVFGGHNTLTQTKSIPFKDTQITTFSDVTPGDLLSIKVVGYSKGMTPARRVYTTEQVNIPAMPEFDGSLTGTTDQITVGFSAAGIKHFWVMSIQPKHGNCSEGCIINGSETEHSFKGLQFGQVYKFSIRSLVVYNGQSQKSRANSIQYALGFNSPKISVKTLRCDRSSVHITANNFGDGLKCNMYKDGVFQNAVDCSHTTATFTFLYLSPAADYTFSVNVVSELFQMESDHDTLVVTTPPILTHATPYSAVQFRRFFCEILPGQDPKCFGIFLRIAVGVVESGSVITARLNSGLINNKYEREFSTSARKGTWIQFYLHEFASPFTITIVWTLECHGQKRDTYGPFSVPSSWWFTPSWPEAPLW